MAIRVKNMAELRRKGLSAAIPTAKTPPKPKGPNRTERQYMDFLELLKQTGRIKGYEYEAFKIRIGGQNEKCWYTVDFIVFTIDGKVELHEVKGPREWDDAKVKYKACARLYPQMDFYLAKFNGAAWITRKVNP